MTPSVDAENDVVRSAMKVPEFDKHLKKGGGHIDRNVVEITIKKKTIVRKPLMIKIINLHLKKFTQQTSEEGKRTYRPKR